MNRRAFLNRSLTLTAAAALSSGGAIAYASDEKSAGSAPKEPVRIDTGLVSGVTAALPSVRVFKGIPYAASTAGENRRRPPWAATSWTGVRTADTFGDICPQQVMGAGSVSCGMR